MSNFHDKVLLTRSSEIGFISLYGTFVCPHPGYGMQAHEQNFTHASIANMGKAMNSSVEEITVRIEDENYGLSQINPQ